MVRYTFCMKSPTCATSFRFSQLEFDLLRFLAARNGLSMRAMIGLLIRDRARLEQAAAPPKP